MIKLIGITVIDFSTYVKTTETLLGRSPTRKLDEINYLPGNTESFLLSLGDFKSKNLNDFEIKHINLVFLCSMNLKTAITLHQYNSNINYTVSKDVTESETVFIMSSSLENYLALIKNSERLPIELLEVINEIYFILEKITLSKILSKYKKIKRPDGMYFFKEK